MVSFGRQSGGWLWPAIYGEEVLKSVCESVFGADLRSTLIRRGDWWRRVLISGAPGSGRVAVGHAVRLLLSDGTVPLTAERRASHRSLAISASDFAGDLSAALLGGGRPGQGSGPGLLNEFDGGALLVDEVEMCPGIVQAQLVASLRSHTTRVLGASARADARVHFIAATALGFEQVYGGATDLRRDLIDELSIDGSIELPPLRTIIRSERFWDDAFELLYRRAASDVCGMEKVSLFSVVRPPEDDDAFLTEADAVLEERHAFMNWVCADARLERIRDIMKAAFAEYSWPGDLREFDAALRSIIGHQTSAEVNGPQIESICARLRGQAGDFNRGSSKAVKPANPWLQSFESVLVPLPLLNEGLPEVIGQIEAVYFTEAARRAALASQPRPAKMQDVARMLGLPRQTASRKWQSHGLSSALLSKD